MARNDAQFCDPPLTLYVAHRNVGTMTSPHSVAPLGRGQGEEAVSQEVTLLPFHGVEGAE